MKKEVKDTEQKAIENILKILLPLPEYQKKQGIHFHHALPLIQKF